MRVLCPLRLVTAFASLRTTAAMRLAVMGPIVLFTVALAALPHAVRAGPSDPITTLLVEYTFETTGSPPNATANHAAAWPGTPNLPLATGYYTVVQKTNATAGRHAAECTTHLACVSTDVGTPLPSALNAVGQTVSLWMYMLPSGGWCTVANSGNHPWLQMDTGALGGNIAWSTTDQQSLSGPLFALNTWTHFALVFAVGSPAKAYVNGVLVSTAVNATAATPHPWAYDFGGCQGSGWAAQLDDVRLYGFAATAPQIATIYAGNEVTPTMAPTQAPTNAPTGSPTVTSPSLYGQVLLALYTFESGSLLNEANNWIGTPGTPSLSGLVTIQPRFGGPNGTHAGQCAAGYWCAVLPLASVFPDINNVTARTMSLWIYANPSTSDCYAITNSNTGNYQPRLLASGAMQVRWDTDVGSTTIGSLFTANTWQHIVHVTQTGVPAKLYVNGVLAFTSADPVSAPPLLWDYSFGNGCGTDAPVQIDDVRVYGYAVTPSQVATLYAGGALVDPTLAPTAVPTLAPTHAPTALLAPMQTLLASYTFAPGTVHLNGFIDTSADNVAPAWPGTASQPSATGTFFMTPRYTTPGVADRPRCGGGSNCMHIDVAAALADVVGLPAQTVSLWINWNGTRYSFIDCHALQVAGRSQPQLHLDGSVSVTWDSDETASTAAGVFALGAWTHIARVLEVGTVPRLYVNGVSVLNATGATASAPLPWAFAVAQTCGYGDLNPIEVENVQIFGFAATAAQVATLAAGGDIMTAAPTLAPTEAPTGSPTAAPTAMPPLMEYDFSERENATANAAGSGWIGSTPGAPTVVAGGTVVFESAQDTSTAATAARMTSYEGVTDPIARGLIMNASGVVELAAVQGQTVAFWVNIAPGAELAGVPVIYQVYQQPSALALDPNTIAVCASLSVLVDPNQTETTSGLNSTGSSVLVWAPLSETQPTGGWIHLAITTHNEGTSTVWVNGHDMTFSGKDAVAGVPTWDFQFLPDPLGVANGTRIQIAHVRIYQTDLDKPALDALRASSVFAAAVPSAAPTIAPTEAPTAAEASTGRMTCPAGMHGCKCTLHHRWIAADGTEWPYTLLVCIGTLAAGAAIWQHWTSIRTHATEGMRPLESDGDSLWTRLWVMTKWWFDDCNNRLAVAFLPIVIAAQWLRPGGADPSAPAGMDTEAGRAMVGWIAVGVALVANGAMNCVLYRFDPVFLEAIGFTCVRLVWGGALVQWGAQANTDAMAWGAAAAGVTYLEAFALVVYSRATLPRRHFSDTQLSAIGAFQALVFVGTTLAILLIAPCEPSITFSD